MNITISEEARAKMDESGILEADVTEVVEHAESGQKLFNEENGRFLGKKRLEAMTVYAEYAADGDNVEVFDVYKHRVCFQKDL